MSLDGKVVFVTGAARGIGFATAAEALARNASVVLADNDQAALDDAAAGLTGNKLVLTCDVTSQEQVQAAIEQTLTHFGAIDILVNNAGTVTLIDALELKLDQWRREIDISLTGSFLMAQAAATLWMKEHGGSIVNLGSGASLSGLPHCVSYVAAKHGVIGMTKALAVDWARFGIRVNCVCPGFTWTDLGRKSMRLQPEIMKERIARIPLQRGAEPEEVAQAILYFASPTAGFVTGQTLAVDGGQQALSSGYPPPK